MYITLLVKPCALCSALAEINYIEDDRNDLQNGRDTFTSTVQSLIMHMIGEANLGQILMHYDIFTPKLCIISLCIMSDCTVH